MVIVAVVRSGCDVLQYTRTVVVATGTCKISLQVSLFFRKGRL